MFFFKSRILRPVGIYRQTVCQGKIRPESEPTRPLYPFRIGFGFQDLVGHLPVFNLVLLFIS